MYWQAVLKEVLNRSSQPCLFTNIKNKTEFPPPEKKPPRFDLSKAYQLGGKYSGIYLTRREAECMLYLIRGKTVAMIADDLKLSPRTVEFYVKNLKDKMHCKNRPELIDKMLHSNFLEIIDF